MIILPDIAFSVLDLHSVYLWVAGFNERAIAFYEKLASGEARASGRWPFEMVLGMMSS